MKLSLLAAETHKGHTKAREPALAPGFPGLALRHLWQVKQKHGLARPAWLRAPSDGRGQQAAARQGQGAAPAPPATTGSLAQSWVGATDRSDHHAHSSNTRKEKKTPRSLDRQVTVGGQACVGSGYGRPAGANVLG
jgi:hypothetical protein